MDSVEKALSEALGGTTGGRSGQYHSVRCIGNDWEALRHWGRINSMSRSQLVAMLIRQYLQNPKVLDLRLQ